VLLPQTPFKTNEVLLKIDTLPQYIPPQTDSLLIKRKYLGMSKHRFAFNKPTLPTPELLEFKRIEKPKEIIKKN
jgi:hypothetical protein